MIVETLKDLINRYGDINDKEIINSIEYIVSPYYLNGEKVLNIFESNDYINSVGDTLYHIHTNKGKEIFLPQNIYFKLKQQ
jgi:hypothetical protein